MPALPTTWIIYKQFPFLQVWPVIVLTMITLFHSLPSKTLPN